MPEKVTYYAIVDSFSTRYRPAGVLRRVEWDGGRRDEAFGRNLTWGQATTRYSAGHDDELFEITSDEAGTIIARMRRDGARM
jgi:hypothetical protein